MKEEIKKVLESKKTLHVLYGVGICIVAIAIFQAGVFVGFKKASFGRMWGENYIENFGPGHRGLREVGMVNRLPSSNGAVGTILKVDLPTIAVEGSDGIEKIVLLSAATHIKRGRSDISVEELRVDDSVVVIGSPNNKGQIEAKLVRVMPTSSVETKTK